MSKPAKIHGICLDDRFQNQPWYVKLWRYRHYLYIPYNTIKSYILVRQTEPPEYYLSLRQVYSISKGLAQSKMKWYYTWEETKEYLEQVK